MRSTFRQLQKVQLILNQLFIDSEFCLADAHKELRAVCSMKEKDEKDLKVLNALDRQIIGPLTALLKLIKNAGENELCFWHGEMCNSVSRNKITGEFDSINYCPDCGKYAI
jgi:hypothetical protein